VLEKMQEDRKENNDNINDNDVYDKVFPVPDKVKKNHTSQAGPKYESLSGVNQMP
jgi:hypothetical protein